MIMNVNDFISKENASQKFSATNSIASANKKPLNTQIFDEYADSDNRKNKESDLKGMNVTCKRGDATIGISVLLKEPCYLEQSTEAHINKLIPKTQNDDSISLLTDILTDNELIKASNLSESKSKSTAAVQPPPGYTQPIYKDDLKLNIEHATIRALNVTLNEDQAIDIDEEQDEGQDEELEASLLYANFMENQKKQLINSAIIVEKQPSVDSCYNLLEDDIIDKRESLYEEYKKFFYEAECHCEPSQNIYSMRDGKLSKPLQRKLLTLDQIMRSYQAPLSDRLIGFDVNSKTSYEKIMEKFKNGDDAKALLAYTAKNQDHKNKLFRLLRSICERVLIYDISLCDQFHYQVQQQQDQQQNLNSNNMDDSSTAGNSSVSSTIATNPLKVLWNEMRNRSCQFLGPQVQEDVLNFVLRALEQFPRLSRRVLVYYVVFMLKKDYPKVSKTSIGHVVQLLYRAGCFKVEKRDKDASLMELKREYTKYEALRRQHDAQIIQIGMESGIRMTPEKWSQTLYGDSAHKSEMQSIIDKLQSLHTFEQLIIDFYGKIKSYGLEDISTFDEKDFEFIASINFEKKQPRTVNSLLDEEDNNDPLNDSKTKVPSSAQSEEDQNNEYQDTLSENFDFTNDSDLMRRRSSIQQKSETQNVHILWALLCECQKRTFYILKAHADFSSKIMNKIIANQNIIIATNSNQHGGQSSYRGPNSMSGSGGYSQQQPWSQNRPQNARAPYRHQNNPHYVSNYDKRNQESLNNHGLKAMGTNNNQPYRQQQQFRNISNSTGVSTGFSNRTSAGYQNRGSITNSSGYSTWNDSLSTNSYADPDEMVNSIPQSSFFYNNQDQQVFQPFSSNKVQHQKPSSWGGAQYAYNPSNNKQTNMANMKQRTMATNGNMNLNQHNATIKK